MRSMAPDHPDFAELEAIADEVIKRIGAVPDEAFTDSIVEAIEFVLDPVRTGRTQLFQLDKIEKTFIGLKVEHFIRDLLDAPKGIRDLTLAGRDVDVKNTIGSQRSWMIPPETYEKEEPVLLIAADEISRTASMGLMVARMKYLGAPNRDRKRRTLKVDPSNILWLLQDKPWPPNRWEGLNMERFRELREVQPGAKRAAIFFEENLDRVVHRTVLQSLLFDQLDPMKRLRGNGGARDLLLGKGIALLSGRYDSVLLAKLSKTVGPSEFVATTSLTPNEMALIRSHQELPSSDAGE